MTEGQHLRTPFIKGGLKGLIRFNSGCSRSVEMKDDIKTFIEYSHSHDSSHDLQVGETEITPKMSNNVKAAKSHKLLELFISFHCFVDMHY